MIRAVIFDLDGTLVATERLKALSYARAADELQPTVDHEQPAMDAFAAVVGQHRREVAIHLMRTLGVEALAARHVLQAIGLADSFDFVVTNDDVEHNKPEPEIYLLVAQELGVSPAECIVIEDSPSGVRAALAAGMRCIAVGTDFTRDRLHTEGLLGDEWIVDDPERLPATLRQAFDEASCDIVS